MHAMVKWQESAKSRKEFLYKFGGLIKRCRHEEFGDGDEFVDYEEFLAARIVEIRLVLFEHSCEHTTYRPVILKIRRKESYLPTQEFVIKEPLRAHCQGIVKEEFSKTMNLPAEVQVEPQSVLEPTAVHLSWEVTYPCPWCDNTLRGQPYKG